jgi:hypothetical protein
VKTIGQFNWSLQTANHMDLSIVIPHRGNVLGLWSTVYSCEIDLQGTAYDHQYVIVSNGDPVDKELEQVLHYLDKAGKLVHVHEDSPLTPPAARQRGAEVAAGKRLFFFDNHCLVTPRYFNRAMVEMDETGSRMLHSTTMFNMTVDPQYHYRLKLDYNFWGGGSMFPQSTYKPYRIAASGHGGFVIDRDLFVDVGGYGPDTLFAGYGGEELIFDLKLWRYGHENWISPKLIHYHYAGKRGYDRHYTDEYYTNLLVSAHVIGGERWMYRVFDSFVNKSHIWFTKNPDKYKILQDAYERSAQYAAEVNARSKYTLDELLEKFKRECVAME